MKTMFIMRGIPGSGKSTHANRINLYMDVINVDSKIFSTDNYWMVGGEYKFQPALLGEAHKDTQRQVRDHMIQIDHEGLETAVIIIDNTNILKSHMKPYEDMAKEYGWHVNYITVGKFDDEFVDMCAERNTHGVPHIAVSSMAKRFQP